jgi:uncharacterized protein YozE (UPF0346 family)
MGFKTWLKQFRKDQTAIGDLARDVSMDKEFTRSQKKETIREYLMDKNARPLALDTFDRAWAAFAKSHIRSVRA